MGGTLSNYNFGGGGVNLVKDPLQLGDDEATQLQNAELVPDQSKGGEGALSKRGGLAALNSALAGSVLGAISLPLQTTYARTLYVSLGSNTANNWKKTTDGTTFTGTATPQRATKWTTTQYETNGTASTGARRGVSFKTVIMYPGDGFVSDTASPSTNTTIPIVSWDGTTSTIIMYIPVGAASTDGNFPFSVTDMLLANGKVYFSVHETPASGSDRHGTVYSFNPMTNEVLQVASGFGSQTGEVTGGLPMCMAWHQGQLFVGLNNANGDDGVGKVVRCYPDIDTTWTTDTAALRGATQSMVIYQGDLYVGCRGNATFDACIQKRTQSTGAWTVSDTITTSGVDFYAGLTVYGTDLYAMVYSDGGADVLVIRKLTGGSWSTDRDVAALDCTAGVAQYPGMGVVFGSDLFFAFKSIGDTSNDGFILRKSAGTWSKVLTDNINGRLLVLTERS